MTENTQTQENSEDVKFPLDASKEKENSADSSTEETNANSTDSSSQDKKETDEKNESGNFADHPRWKERESDWSKRFNDQETRHTQEIENIRKDIESKFEKKRENLADSDIPGWFGGDEEAWRQYQAHEESRLNQAEERAIKKLEERADKQQKAIDDATQYFNDELKSIENNREINTDGAKIDRNKLLKFTMDNDLVDSKGRWNYRVAFKLMKAGVTNAKNESTGERKKIAAATTSENRAESKQSNFTTSTDFQKPGARPW